jgi:hypothetical protein
MDEMHHSNPAEHAQHDLDLISGHAAGDLTDTQRIRADALLHSCTSCADLRRDLVAIAAATRTLPAQTAPRDFRLTAAQAARLRRGGWLKSLLRPFAAPRSSVRPIAMAFTSLGLAGLLVTTVLPSFLFFGSAGAAAPRAANVPAASTGPAGEVPGPLSGAGNPAPTDTSAQFGPVGQPSSAPVRAGSSGGKSTDTASTAPEVAGGLYGQQASGGDAQKDQLTAGRDAERESIAPQPSPILIGSLVLLALGLALFGVRFVARRAL